MIGFLLQKEPDTFDRDVRQKGRRWIAQAQNVSNRERPPAYWTACQPDLRRAFRDLCAYTAMKVAMNKGTVDHYRSWRQTRATDPGLAYEWSNYRFASHWANTIKGKHDDEVLDPFVVKDGWFRVILPSMQLIATDAIPPEYREVARTTLIRLHLQDDEDLIEYRREWYDKYRCGEAGFSQLEQWVPLVARAVKALEDAGQLLP